MRLSIIVPIYKVEAFLSKCIDSLLDQDLPEKDYEIILVDDGSPDQCGAICDSYALRHANIKVVHRSNGGLSAARNCGIDIAEGRFLQFVDSDDYLEPNVLKALVEKAEIDELDVLRFNYQNVNEQYEVFEPNKVSRPFMDYCDEQCDGLTFLTERLGYGCYAWQFIIRRELLEDCRFKEGIYFEDTEWTPRLLLKAERVTSTHLIAYNYLMRQGSITQSVDEEKKRKVLEDKLRLIDAMQTQMRELDDRQWFEGMIAQTVLSILCYVSQNYYDKRKKYLHIIKETGVFPLSTYHVSSRAARKIRLINASPDLFCHIMRIKLKKG